MIKDTSYKNGLFHVVYDTQENLGKALCRFQEHYESPEFRGKVFTLGQFREYYCNFRGAWTYYQDWSGYNFPSSNLFEFRRGSFDPLTPEEAEFFELMRYKRGKFYIIGTSEDCDDSIVPHERLHALWYTNEEYQQKVKEFLGNCFMKHYAPIMEHFVKLGYHEAVHWDELHAYLGASMDYLTAHKLVTPQVKEISNTLREIIAPYVLEFEK